MRSQESGLEFCTYEIAFKISKEISDFGVLRHLVLHRTGMGCGERACYDIEFRVLIRAPKVGKITAKNS